MAYSFEEVKRIIKEIDDRVTIDESTYKNYSTKCRMVDIEYGEFWKKPNSIVRQGTGHPKRQSEKYAKTAKSKIDDVEVKVRITNPKLTICRDTYTNTYTKCMFHEEGYGWFETLPKDVISGKCQGHPNTRDERRYKTCEERYGDKHVSRVKKFRDKAAKTNLSRYGYACLFNSPKIKDKIAKSNMKKFGVANPFSSKLIMRKIKKTNMEKYGCEYAMQNEDIKNRSIETRMSISITSSTPELELKEWIESNFDVDVERSYIGGNNPKEIDLLIKKDGVNILAIEYNGEYWHSERTKDKNYHKRKTEQVRLQKNCQLIHIFDSEWQTKKEVIKGFIRSKLEKGTPIRASKCEVREVSWNEVKKFCNNYHLQGKPQHSKLSLGLYHKDELVSLMTFSKPHRQNMGDEYHLSRYVIKYGYRIHGGLSRLSKHAHSKIGDFITYVHLRLSSGDSYLKAGYKHVGDVDIDYWYWDTKKRIAISKQSRRKSNVNTPGGMTEKEHAEMDGLYRIWDCGKIKLKYSH